MEFERTRAKCGHIRGAQDRTGAEDGAAAVVARSTEDNCAVEVRVADKSRAGAAAADEDLPRAGEPAASHRQDAAAAAEAVGIAKGRDRAGVSHVAVGAEEHTRKDRASGAAVKIEVLGRIRRERHRARGERRDALEGRLERPGQG